MEDKTYRGNTTCAPSTTLYEMANMPLALNKFLNEYINFRPKI